MQISFFEEFPSRKNLEKIRLVSWPTTLYLAAKSYSEFQRLEKIARGYKYVIKCIYWPTLQRQEGYWISPFSSRKALLRIFKELEDKNTPLLIDAELPTRQNPGLYLTEGLHFWRNRTLIQQFIKKHPRVYVAEYFPRSSWNQKILTLLGLHFNPSVYDCTTIKMLYNSLHHFPQSFLQQYLEEEHQKYGVHFIAAFGTISRGIAHTEPRLSIKQLQQNLLAASEAGIKEVIIYRLGGLNKKYAAVLQQWQRKL